MLPIKKMCTVVIVLIQMLIPLCNLIDKLFKRFKPFNRAVIGLHLKLLTGNVALKIT